MEIPPRALALEVAIEAARLGGDVLQDWAGRFSVREKNPADLVTEADFGSQRAIHEHISAAFPEHGFLGEEGLSRETSSPCRWIIDPLDGTCNYVHGYPFYAVSIALEIDSQLAIGVILDPTRPELFVATRGGGAFLNDQPVHPSNVASASEALVVASMPQKRSPDHPAVARFLNAMPRVQNIQRTGSAALNLAYVACGRSDAFWSTSLKPWDQAAGALIVEEAGGKVSSLDGASFDVNQPSVLATNRRVHSEMVEILK